MNLEPVFSENTLVNLGEQQMVVENGVYMESYRDTLSDFSKCFIVISKEVFNFVGDLINIFLVSNLCFYSLVIFVFTGW